MSLALVDGKGRILYTAYIATKLCVIFTNHGMHTFPPLLFLHLRPYLSKQDMVELC